jgi:hypothetical protein
MKQHLKTQFKQFICERLQRGDDEGQYEDEPEEVLPHDNNFLDCGGEPIKVLLKPCETPKF